VLFISAWDACRRRQIGPREIVAHGMITTQAETINADLLAFIKS
jgi:hypothetical protein